MAGGDGEKAANRDNPWLQMYAIRQIKGFSHSVDKSELGEYVDDHFDPTGPSALSIPFSRLRIHI
jgi:hypothetical protein